MVNENVGEEIVQNESIIVAKVVPASRVTNVKSNVEEDVEDALDDVKVNDENFDNDVEING